MKEIYEQLGISEEVYNFGAQVETSLKSALRNLIEKQNIIR